MTYHDTTPRRAPVPISPLAILGDLSAIQGFSSIHARTLLEEHIAACMGILDALDGDADDEPSLGSVSSEHPLVSQAYWSEGGAQELEFDQADDEPSLGWTTWGLTGGVFDLEDDGDDKEPDVDSEAHVDCEPNSSPFVEDQTAMRGARLVPVEHYA